MSASYWPLGNKVSPAGARLNSPGSWHGCDPLAQIQRSKLQHQQSQINQQINKEMRMRAGAENLFRSITLSYAIAYLSTWLFNVHSIDLQCREKWV
ncbi:UNVERIFIED_CONTAM: hypothetical protein FKN15_066850 [Acipenser sinensis]